MNYLMTSFSPKLYTFALIKVSHNSQHPASSFICNLTFFQHLRPPMNRWFSGRYPICHPAFLSFRSDIISHITIAYINDNNDNR